MPGNANRLTPRRIAVVGGGIAGLTAAYYLARARQSGAPVEEYLLEASPRLGGALRTEWLEGCLVEAGADSFLTEKSEALALCAELGLAGEVIGSEDAQRRTWILHKGKLEALPEGLEFFVPTNLLALARTGLLSWREKLTTLRDLRVRPRERGADESVASFVERHFGRGVLERIAEPLLAAVYGGDIEQLSAPAVLPWLVELERRHGSLLRALRAAKKQATGLNQPPLFSALRGGFEQLVGALQAKLAQERILCGRPGERVERAGAGYRLHFSGAHTLEAEAMILALPAWESARLLRDFDTELGSKLAKIPYSSSLLVALVYDKTALRLRKGFGFLVPRKEGRRLRACTFVGQKFRHRVPPGREVLRCFLGGVGDEAVLDLSEEEAVTLVRKELAEILGVRAAPRAVQVFRWQKALAQYTVGHGERLRAIEQRLAQHRGLFLAGNAYRGIGVPDCIRSGREAAEACLRCHKLIG